MNKARILCEKCSISLSFGVNRIPSNCDFVQVSNRADNDILLEIFKSKEKLTSSYPFIILVNGSRYSIELLSKNVLSRNRVEMNLKQIFLHNDCIRKKLVPVSVRLVKIVVYIAQR